MNMHRVKWAQCDKPNPANCKNCSSKCAQLQYTIQRSSDVMFVCRYKGRLSELFCVVLGMWTMAMDGD